MEVIRFSNVTKKYRNKEVIRHMNFSIEEKKIIGLVGRNGAGKSTLMKLIAGHLKSLDGEIKVFGQSPFNNLHVATNLIFIEDRMSFPPLLTIKDTFKMAGDFYPNWQSELAKMLLNYANISENALHQHLSKGQKATVNLIYGLATRCAVTLLDEPMNGMDEVIRTDMYRAILKEYIAYPRTIILSSHHLQEIEHLLEDILLIDEGCVKLHAPLEDVKQMAVRVIGEKNEVRKIIGNAEILFEKDTGIHYEVVIRAEGFNPNGEQVDHVSIQPVSASDVYIYLTNKTKGGIDDVFK